MWTKAQIIEQAFAVLGLGDYAFDMSAEERQSAVRTLDGMMALWDGDGIRLGYLMATNEADLNTDSGLPDWAMEAVYMNLAIRIGQAQGKQVHPSTYANAKAALGSVQRRTTYIPQRVPNWHNMPAGAGNRGWRGPFLSPEPEVLEAGPDGPLEF